MRILDTCPHCDSYYGPLGCFHLHDCPDYNDGQGQIAPALAEWVGLPKPVSTEAFRLDVKDGNWTGTFEEWQARGKPKAEARMSDRDWAARSAGERDAPWER